MTKKRLALAVFEREIESGPRIKSLATQHLEYIAYALLDQKTHVIFKNDSESDLLVTINDRKFNLSDILRATPDFGQLIFTKLQLDQCSNMYSANYISTLDNGDAEHSHLHIVEKCAINQWTGGIHGSINKLLRNFTINAHDQLELKRILLTICIASHGLSKPLSSTQFCKQVSYRGERYGGSYLDERKQRAEEKLLVTNRGFTGTSTNEHCGLVTHAFSSTYFFQPLSLNPIAKNIVSLSGLPGEAEVLYPPNTEFIYLSTQAQVSAKWLASPVRSANPIDATKYQSGFSKAELTAILIHKQTTKLNILADYLRKQIDAKTPSFLKTIRWAKLSRLQIVADEINKQLESTLSIPAMNSIIKTINESLKENKYPGGEYFTEQAAKNNLILADVLSNAEDIRANLFTCYRTKKSSFPEVSLVGGENKRKVDEAEEGRSRKRKM